MKNISFLLLFFLCISLRAQKQANNWHFGDSAAIAFEKNQIRTLDNSPMVARGPSVSYSDPKSGELLFISNGLKIWNSDYEIMSNGDNLLGRSFDTEVNNTTNQTYTIPNPADSNEYYLFYFNKILVDENTFEVNLSLYYSVLNPYLNNRGTILPQKKNIHLRDTLAERVAVIPHTNNRDYWLLLHGLNSNVFYTYLITATGIQFVREQAIGSFVSSEFQEYEGVLKASPDNRKIVMTNSSFKPDATRKLELYDFDNSSGALSNLRDLGNYELMYGVSFSPNSQLIYVKGSPIDNSDDVDFVYQIDLTKSDPVSSRIGLIRNDTRYSNIKNLLAIFQLELAPNGKIYGAGAISFEEGTLANNLLVINNPNEPGRACNVTFTNLNYSEQRVNNFLPTFPQFIFNNLEPVNDSETTCLSPSTLTIFPNPTSEYISFLRNNDCQEPFTAIIVNSLGQRIASYFRESNSIQNIDISFLADGTYNLLIQSSNIIFTKRFLKINGCAE